LVESRIKFKQPYFYVDSVSFIFHIKKSLLNIFLILKNRKKNFLSVEISIEKKTQKIWKKKKLFQFKNSLSPEKSPFHIFL